MANTALNSWNAIRARHEALSKDAKFKPDKLTALCEKLDDLGSELEQQKDEQIKARKIADDAGYAFEAAAKKMADKFNEMKRISDQMANIDMGDIESDDAVKQVSKATAGFVVLAKELADVAQEVVKASDEQARILKKMAEQFKARREAIDTGIKKTKGDGTKTLDQIKQQVDVFRKIAAGMKDNELAKDIASLNSVVTQLYSVQ